MIEPAERSPRPYCWACRRARSLCTCDVLRPCAIGFELALLMHPKEARVAIGTGRLAHRAVAGSHLLVGDRFEHDPRIDTLFARPELAPVVLFPSAHALDLDRPAAPDVRALFAPGTRPLVLVLDGTWTTAKKLLRHAPRLAALPALRFRPPRPSRYGRLRKEPRAECWSTLEAVHHVIDRFDALGIAAAPPDRAHDHLLALMDTVVSRQLVFEPADSARGYDRAGCT